ncbi:ApbE family lipoprotein [Psychromonas sp. CNPT3]|uniref:FAD:protein FMN transferase n=1 Tax=Psychromonas sp. CNPT3 TaxID=314282 RepID=UPI00006E5653|nr:FAD:protein FMN transferase [Psychromonas sp. CNPT3]AGH81777.1 ApbE family lipoprotein [Psychromonas sp. CNPT3]
MILRINKWLALIGLAFFLSSCAKVEPEVVQLQGNTMGTYYKITFVLDAEQQKQASFANTQLKAAIDKRLELVNDQMSTYRVHSELSLFNQSKQSFVVSKATASVVKAALKIFKESQGAYDISVGPLVNLWGFGPDKKPTKVPTDSMIATQKTRVGSQYLSVQGTTLQKSLPDLYIDLSSIAKGYGVDVIAQYLQSLGINNYLVDIGGELRANGMKPAQKPWTLAIERPTLGQNIEQVMHIGDNAVATSGDYRNYYEYDGIRYSHTIDPSTGKPITHKLASVTVIHKSCMLADGYATAITVLGPKAGLEFAKKHQLAVFLIVKEGDKFIESYTDAFKKYLVTGAP